MPLRKQPSQYVFTPTGTVVVKASALFPSCSWGNGVPSVYLSIEHARDGVHLPRQETGRDVGAVSQLLWSHKGREELFSLGENHERRRGFGLPICETAIAVLREAGNHCERSSLRHAGRANQRRDTKPGSREDLFVLLTELQEKIRSQPLQVCAAKHSDFSCPA